MKYFCKYLPIKGEIKEGDKILNPYNEIQTCISLEKGIGINEICWIKVKETTTLQQILNSQKVKFYLCSRDIQVGDIVSIPSMIGSFQIHEEGKEPIENSVITLKYAIKANAYKVIGEISKDAIWVTEGDEFEEENLQLVIWDKSETYADEFSLNEVNRFLDHTKEIRIRCSNCKTFH